MATTIIAVANQKGGVGKTTTTVSLGHGLALHGKRVLLVDLDVQGHTSVALGREPEPGLRQLLVNKQPLVDVIVSARDCLDLLPGDRTTEEAKISIAGMAFRERVLADRLQPAIGAYDVILIDCAPSADVLHIAALIAADLLLVPTKLDHLAVHGVTQLLDMLQTVRDAGYATALAGVIPTFYERRTNETHTQLQAVVQAFGQFVWPPIPQDTKAREVPAYGQTLWERRPWSSAVLGFQATNGSGPKRIGGYQAALERLLEMLA